nr:DNA polymerase III subunit beta [uncultured Allomuricauda sp.]
MKFTADTKAFLSAMARISPCIPTNTTNLVLYNALFNIKDGILDMTATNFEITATTFINVESEGNTSFCVDQKKLQSIIKNAVAPRFEAEVKDKVVIVQLEKSTYELPLVETNSYPDVSFKTQDGLLEVDGSAFFEALIEAKKFTNTDTLRQFFNVHITNFGGRIEAQATDNFTGYLNSITDCKDQEFSLLIPNRCISFFETVHFDEASLKMGYNGNSLLVKDDITQVSIILTDSEFPKIHMVFPEDDRFTSKFECDKTSLIGAINRLSVVYGTTNDKIIRLDFSNDMSIISSNDTSMNTSGKEYVPGTHTGDNFSIGFNASYFLRGIQYIDSDLLEIHMISPKMGIILKDENRTVLVMPSLLKD